MLGKFKFAFAILFTFFLSVSSFAAKNFKGFVQISPNRELFIDYIPAEAGKPTLILLNGLTYNTKSWDPMMEYIKGQGYGILRYDAFGQGQTLLKYAPIMDIIKIEDQAQDLALLIKKLGIKSKVDLAGLSYGGGLAVQFAAAYPKITGKVILMAPFVAPLPSQDALIKSQVAVTRAMFPLNPYSNDQLYDYFLHQIIYTTSPVAEPVVLKNPFILEATFRMTQGIRKMEAIEYMQFLNKNSVHLVIAMRDQYIPFAVLDNFWKNTPKSVRVSRINILASEHKIPENWPRFMGGWINEIMHSNPEISKDREFTGNPLLRVAKCGNILIKLK